MRPASPFSACLLSALLLAGCTTPATPPRASEPAPTTGAAPATADTATAPVDARPASIKGSEESSTLLDNFTAFIRAIDGQPVSAGRQGWNQPLSLPPGARRISVEFIRGSFFARTELALEAKPAAAYELRQANDAQVYGKHSFCEFWIVDLATGEKVSEPKRVALDKVKTGR